MRIVAGILSSLYLGLTLFGLYQYKAHNRSWGMKLVVWIKSATQLAIAALFLAGCASDKPRLVPANAVKADAGELKQFPLDPNLPGDPPKSGLRHWSGPFFPLPYSTTNSGNSYVSVVQPPSGGIEFWANGWGPKGAVERTIFVRRGPTIDTLGDEEIMFDGMLINDVPDMKDPGKLAPGRGFTRPYMMYDAEVGYVLLCCVCPDYKPGSVPLLPALVVSETGEKGSWKYLGKLKGEPQTEYETRHKKTKQHIWSDGGTIIRLKDKRWRVYLNGFGQTMAVLESDRIEGPWKFRRDGKGKIIEFLTAFPRTPRRSGIWLNVLRIADDNWHVWLTDTWVPQSIWHYESKDGLTWKPYGKQPEITRAAVGNRGLKCLRTYYDRHTRNVVGLLAVWTTKPDGSKGWMPNVSRMTLTGRELDAEAKQAKQE